MFCVQRSFARRANVLIAQRTFASKSNAKVYFDMKIGDKKAGRIVFEVPLF